MSTAHYIYVMSEGITEHDVALIKSSTADSKYYDFSNKYSSKDIERAWDKIFGYIESENPYVLIDGVPSIELGSTTQYETSVSKFMDHVYATIGESLPILNDTLINAIMDAYPMSNDSRYDFVSHTELINFLIEHIGHQVFVD